MGRWESALGGGLAGIAGAGANSRLGPGFQIDAPVPDAPGADPDKFTSAAALSHRLHAARGEVEELGRRRLVDESVPVTKIAARLRRLVDSGDRSERGRVRFGHGEVSALLEGMRRTLHAIGSVANYWLNYRRDNL